MPSFKDKVVLITGAGQGIGKDAADLFASKQASLVITDIDLDRLESTANLIRSKYETEVLTFHGDISKPEDNKRLIQLTLDKYAKLDILVNNAGIGKQNDIYSENIISDFDEQFSINVKGMVSLIIESVEVLKQSKGNIVNLSSIASFETMENVLIHTMTKATVTKLTQCLAAELGPFGIRINEVAWVDRQTYSVFHHLFLKQTSVH